MKKYTKKQITNAIAYWKNILENLNEETIQDRRDAAIKRLEQNKTNSASDKVLRKLNSIPELEEFSVGNLKSKVFVYKQRPIVIANLHGQRIPFYCSTGLAGKTSALAKPGNWFLFFGIGNDGWLNKIGFDEEHTITNMWGSKICQDFCKKLDNQIGDIAGILDDTEFCCENEKEKQLIDAVNTCYRKPPITHEESRSANKIYDYLINVLYMFNELKEADNVKAIDDFLFSRGYMVYYGTPCYKKDGKRDRYYQFSKPVISEK